MIGLVELLKSKKATLSLIIVACATTALFTKHLDGTSYAAVIATVATIYNFCQHRIDVAQVGNTIVNNVMPDRGKL